MKRRFTTAAAFLLFAALSAFPQKVTIHATDKPAASVFRTIVEQTGMNFVYSSEILNGVKVSVDASNEPLRKVLDKMFSTTGIEYSIKGKNIVLKQRKKQNTRKPKKQTASKALTINPKTNIPEGVMLEELMVVSRLEAPAVETAEIGTKKLTGDDVRNTPTLFGESDVIKALQRQPGVAEATEGMAGMNVHGGDTDQNLYMLDNVPIYQVNHFGGLFSAFNPEIIRYADFYKSSFPAKYDGRLSSFMDVRTKNGNLKQHTGTARIGLTSGAFNISGPIAEKTSYLVGIRRSWFDVLTIPTLAVANALNKDEKIRFHYYFMDLNAKINHRFSTKASAFVSVYFGDDFMKTGTNDNVGSNTGSLNDYSNNMHWGNIVAQAGLNYRFNNILSAEFTAAYTRYFSSMKNQDKYIDKNSENDIHCSSSVLNTSNNINDWIARGDFDWTPADNSHIRFGANFTRHSFLPQRSSREFHTDNASVTTRDTTWAYRANEANAYIEDDWRLSELLRMNVGIHASLFYIDGKLKHGLSPRLSVSCNPNQYWAIKGAYSRTTQYVHQLSQCYMSLPTDQWIPITGSFKPEVADKWAAGVYWQSDDASLAVSVEAFYKKMRNIIEYSDEYYLKPPLEMWNSRLTSGEGTAKGIDFKIEKHFGHVSGHVAYSLAWANRRFPDKNGGKTYPARFDNRHSFNILLNWEINDKVQLNAAWTAHTGNKFTFMPQIWDAPDLDGTYGDDPPLKTPLNNYTLPFYHRLDIACIVRNRHGFWTFSLYNAYNHVNTVAVRTGYKRSIVSTPDSFTIIDKPVFQKVKFLPIIPSISYTWEF